jgi:hypothetical protein
LGGQSYYSPPFSPPNPVSSWRVSLREYSIHLKGLHHPTPNALSRTPRPPRPPTFAGPLSLFALLALLLPYYHRTHAPCPCHPPSMPVHAPCPCHLPSLPGRPLIRLLLISESDTHQRTKRTRPSPSSVSAIGGGSVALDRGARRWRPVASILALLPVFSAAAPVVVVDVLVIVSRPPCCRSWRL